MKNPLTGFFCTCLMLLATSVPGNAQEKKPDPQPADQAAPVADTTSPSAASPQDPPPQQTPPQNPPAQTPPPDTPAIQRGRVPEPPPPPAKVPDVRRPGESGYWVGVEGWLPREKPIFDRGSQAIFTGVSRIVMQGKPKMARNIELGVAAGLHNTLKFTYTDVRAAGNFVAATDLVAWAKVYTAGTYMSTNYHMQHFRLSYDFLTWPYPVGSRKFRLKTLWQVQYTQVSSVFDSPLDYYDSNGNLLIDPSTGNPINLSASRTVRIISPMFGLGTYYYPSRHFRLEANASGFGFPHRYKIWDADATLNMRVTGHFEVRLGARAFSFKTSTNAEYFLKGTYASAFFGVRWYSNSE